MEDLGTVPDVRIITAAIAYDDPEAWHTYILFYHHALYIPTMQRHLLNPNQMRANDVIVNETPLVLLPYDLRISFYSGNDRATRRAPHPTLAGRSDILLQNKNAYKS